MTFHQTYCNISMVFMWDEMLSTPFEKGTQL